MVDAAGDTSAGLLTRIAGMLHRRTRGSVIRRTVLLQPGDCFDAARVAESERALWALGAFRAVHLDTLRLAPDGPLALRVATVDAWTSRPVLDYTSAGQSTSWQIGLMDWNFLGTATHALASYGLTPDHSTFAFQYDNPHFVRPGAVLSARHAVLSNGHQTTLLAALPFRETRSRAMLTFSADVSDQRALFYGDHTTMLDARTRYTRLRTDVGIALHATTAGYVRLWTAALWREEAWSPSADVPYQPQRFGSVGAGLELARSRYRTITGLNRYGRNEWVSLSRVLRAGVWAAPQRFGYASTRAGHGIELAAQTGAALPSGYATLGLTGDGLYVRDRLDSGQARARLTVVLQPVARHTLILFGDAGSMLGTLPPGAYDLWMERHGPRLFAPHAFLGPRMWWLLVEDRVLVVSSVGGQVAIGMAPFFEYARAWWPDAGVAVAGGNAGVALRLVPLRIATYDVPELALGYRFGDLHGARWAFGLRSAPVF